MAKSRVFRSILLTAGALLLAVSASQSATPPDPAAAPTLLEKKFQRAAQSYMKFQDHGTTVYCKKEKVLTSAIPVVQCLSESQLRLEVENFERTRNAIVRPVVGVIG